MQIDAANRQATFNVGEFARFAPYATPGFGGVSAAWRAQLGTEWHQRIQNESTVAQVGFQNEVPLSGSLVWRNWTLNLSGRIDQIKPPKSSEQPIQLREIKTLSEPLPLAREALLERYPSYPIQLLAYRELLIQNPTLRTGDQRHVDPTPPDFQLTLLLVEIGSGLTQLIDFDSAYDSLLVDHLDALVDYLEAQQERLARLRSLLVRPAYETPRPGQEKIQSALADAFAKSPITLLEAPTGYGKTGVAWEYAARRLASGQSDRVLYLTSKTTGQTEALVRLKSLLSKAASSPNPESDSRETLASQPATFSHIRNKQEHCIHSEFRCSRQSCPYLNDLQEKWKRSGLQRLYLLSHEELDLPTLHAEGRATGICPYELMRASLSHRDIWIADYNYLFSPASSRLLSEQPSFDPARTFLIVDEAHNLPSRVSSAYTYEFSIHPLYAAIDDLSDNQASAPLRQTLKSLAHLLTQTNGSEPTRTPHYQTDLFNNPRAGRHPRSALPTQSQITSDQNRISETDTLDFHHLLAQVAERLNKEPLDYESLQPDTLELLFQLSSAHAALTRGDIKHQLWVPSPGCLRLECIDAAPLIASQLSQYNASLLLSATLTPLDTYLNETGLSKLETESAQIQHLAPPAHWRENAYDVAIDLRVDTRLKSRRTHISTTADTIAAAASALRPAIAFFPSYAYADQVYRELQLKHPFLRCALQPRSAGSLADRAAYLEETLAFNDALLLILGSSYAEGVDSLGGLARVAIVVSPALPEMNFIQEAKRSHYNAQGYDGFERAYLHPGIQKVNQALGRLVRSPDHKVKALLHCQRFADPKTKQLLDPLYQSRNYIQSENDLANWLAP